MNICKYKYKYRLSIYNIEIQTNIDRYRDHTVNGSEIKKNTIVINRPSQATIDRVSLYPTIYPCQVTLLQSLPELVKAVKAVKVPTFQFS